MPLSRYLTIYPDRERPGSWLLYSTRKGSIALLSDRLLEQIRQEALPERYRLTLERLGIWVPDPEAETAALAARIAGNVRTARSFRATVVLTLDCNLDCPYCFEGPFRDGSAMDDATARQLTTFFGRELQQGRDLEISFYGGEPLMALPRLRQIARSLGEAAREHGRAFSFSLVTNGTLLTRPLVESLLPLGLRSVQVTLDGPRELHDQQRPFVGGSGSFDAIVANVKSVRDLVTINPGGNFRRDNYHDFPQLLDQLLAQGITPDMVGPVQFAPVMPASGADTGHGCCPGGSEPWLTEAIIYLRQETVARGFRVPDPAMGICMVELDNALVVNYNGSLYKCPAFMGWPQLSVGTLADGVTDYRASHNLDLWHTDECLPCPYLPLCFGGCRLVPLLNRGVMDRVDCRRPFYDAALESMVRQQLQQSSPSLS
jgi:uncharacterized protein